MTSRPSHLTSVRATVGTLIQIDRHSVSESQSLPLNRSRMHPRRRLARQRSQFYQSSSSPRRMVPQYKSKEVPTLRLGLADPPHNDFVRPYADRPVSGRRKGGQVQCPTSGFMFDRVERGEDSEAIGPLGQLAVSKCRATRPPMTATSRGGIPTSSPWSKPVRSRPGGRRGVNAESV